MKRMTFLTLIGVFVLGVVALHAQEPAGPKVQTVIGAVKSVSGASFTLDAAKKAMNFNVDENTFISAKGAGTKTRARKAAGQGGLTIADVVHEGDGVVVKYVDAGGSWLATEIEVRNPRPASALPVK